MGTEDKIEYFRECKRYFEDGWYAFPLDQSSFDHNISLHSIIGVF